MARNLFACRQIARQPMPPSAHRLHVLLLAWVAGSTQACRDHRPPEGGFTVVEATIPQMQAAMAAGRITSTQLVGQYLTRIRRYDGTLRAIITLNPNALTEAAARDRERALGKVRGPLHGIPIALKDNIQTTDMPTTGGALAFKGFTPPAYAFEQATRYRVPPTAAP